MEPKMPDRFREVYARALREQDLETVAEIVDRVLHAADGFSSNDSDRRDRKATGL